MKYRIEYYKFISGQQINFGLYQYLITMTELYWQRYIQLTALQPLNRKDKFWQNIKIQMQRRKVPKHHLQLYSMCRSENPYIRQVRSSPNITNQTVSQLICRDKSCQLQYCLSLMQIANENRRNKIDLKGCKQQYETMWNCINVQRRNLLRRQQDLRNAVFGITQTQTQQKITVPVKMQQKMEEKGYI